MGYTKELREEKRRTIEPCGTADGTLLNELGGTSKLKTKEYKRME